MEIHNCLFRFAAKFRSVRLTILIILILIVNQIDTVQKLSVLHQGSPWKYHSSIDKKTILVLSISIQQSTILPLIPLIILKNFNFVSIIG